MRRMLIAIGAAGICLVAAGPAWATFPGANGRIAFSYGDDPRGGSFIATMEPDGSDMRVLTAGDLPVWSADGRQIAFIRYIQRPGEDPHPAIFTMRADGSNVRRVTPTPGASDDWHAWSPDGERIAAASYGLLPNSSGYNHVISMRSNGSDRRVLAYHGTQPEWAPDGERIVYVDSNTWDIWVMRPDGTHKQRLYGGPWGASMFFPHYTSSGRSIVFQRCRDEDCQWMQMGAGGANVHRLPGLSGFLGVQPAPGGRCFVGYGWQNNATNIQTTGLDCPVGGWLTDYRRPQAAFLPAWQPLPH